MMEELIKVKHGIQSTLDTKNIIRTELALKIYVELIKSASDKGELLQTNIDKNIALISFKFADTFIEASIYRRK